MPCNLFLSCHSITTTNAFEVLSKQWLVHGHTGCETIGGNLRLFDVRTKFNCIRILNKFIQLALYK